MNSCVLMAEIVKDPELRFMQDGQTAIAEMTVQFPAFRAEDPMEMLKVVGWGNLAQQIQEQFHTGDQDRPEGFKEKRAEFTVGRIHRVQADLNAPRIANNPAATMATPAAMSAPAQPRAAAPATPKPAAAPAAPAANKPPAPSPSDYEPNYDDIPF
jgi:single-strand DNA-binding protein